jgi:uncharacterized protein (TIGR00159 family)
MQSFLDILIISLFFYYILVLFKKTRTFTMFLGVVIVTGLYFIALYFNLFVTLRVLQYLFGISAVLIVIIFQSEIRKFVEFLGIIGTRRIKVGPLASKSPSTSEIIQASVKMAQDKVGALIVIQGQDNLEGYIEGGVTLDGLISEETILSIFFPYSEGHDGALIISNNRISRFAAHLPLSNNFKEIGKHGTRHSAALGISEVSDALAIVVSEEKGRISVSRDGRLRALEEFSDLEKEIDKFITAKFSPPDYTWTTKYLKKNWFLKLIAFLLAIIIRYIAASGS